MTDAVAWVKWRFDRWRGDEGLRMCCLAARGLWADLLAVMHSGKPYGHLAINGRAPTARQIASMVGMTTEREVAALLCELEENGVFSRSPDGLIYCRRMVRDNAARERGVETGSKGGNPSLIAKSHKEDNHDATTPLTVGDNPPPKPREREEIQEKEQEGEREPSLRSVSRSRKKPQVPVPQDWRPDANGVAYARERGVNVSIETQSFINRNTAVGKTYSNLDAAWRVWCDHAVQFGRAPGKSAPLLSGIGASRALAPDYVPTPVSNGFD